MDYQIEILTLLFGLGALGFAMSNLGRLKGIPAWGTFLTGFAMLQIGWIATLFDRTRYGEVFDAIEHVAYSGGILVLAFWTGVVFRRKDDRPS